LTRQSGRAQARPQTRATSSRWNINPAVSHEGITVGLNTWLFWE
jgi:hypothetical protein